MMKMSPFDSSSSSSFPASKQRPMAIIVQFHDASPILTTITRNPDIVTEWISLIEYEHAHRRRMHCLIVGLQIQCQFYTAVTLDLCVGRYCLIYQLVHSPYIPSSLEEFLENPSTTIVGIRVKQAMKMLRKDYNFGFCANTVELWDLAKACGREELWKAGLWTMASAVMKKQLEPLKKVYLGRWDKKRLSRMQIEHASVQVFLRFEVGKRLKAQAYLVQKFESELSERLVLRNRWTRARKLSQFRHQIEEPEEKGTSYKSSIWVSL